MAKGILRGDDAVQAVEAGCDGILVSNHGARQLDGVPSTVTTLFVSYYFTKQRIQLLLKMKLNLIFRLKFYLK